MKFTRATLHLYLHFISITRAVKETRCALCGKKSGEYAKEDTTPICSVFRFAFGEHRDGVITNGAVAAVVVSNSCLDLRVVSEDGNPRKSFAKDSD